MLRAFGGENDTRHLRLDHNHAIVVFEIRKMLRRYLPTLGLDGLMSMVTNKTVRVLARGMLLGLGD